MRILFVRKVNKHNDFIQQFLLFHVSLYCVFTRVPWCMRVNYSVCKQAAAHPGSTSERQLLCQQHHGSCISVYGRVRKLSDFIQTYLKLCSEDERSS